jgi:hypothetical protein
VSSLSEEKPERSSGLLSRRAREVAKCTDDLFDKVGEGGALSEEPSFDE